MHDPGILALDIKTHLVIDTSPEGRVLHSTRIKTTIGGWWTSQIDWEALGQTYGMDIFRPYLVESWFHTWVHYEPLVSFFN